MFKKNKISNAILAIQIDSKLQSYLVLVFLHWLCKYAIFRYFCINTKIS